MDGDVSFTGLPKEMFLDLASNQKLLLLFKLLPAIAMYLRVRMLSTRLLDDGSIDAAIQTCACMILVQYVSTIIVPGHITWSTNLKEKWRALNPIAAAGTFLFSVFACIEKSTYIRYYNYYWYCRGLIKVYFRPQLKIYIFNGSRSRGYIVPSVYLNSTIYLCIHADLLNDQLKGNFYLHAAILISMPADYT